MKQTKDSGYILLSRSIQNNPLYASEKFTKSAAWIDLLLLANYKPSHFFCRGIKISVGVGQLAISQNTLARKWLWSKGSVIRFLKHLESESMIVQQKSFVINLISIVNYTKYQQRSTTNGTTNRTANGTAGGTHPIKVKERKEGAAPIPTGNGLAPIKNLKP